MKIDGIFQIPANADQGSLATMLAELAAFENSSVYTAIIIEALDEARDRCERVVREHDNFSPETAAATINANGTLDAIESWQTMGGIQAKILHRIEELNRRG